MPGFATHYIFGEEVQKRYADNYIKQCIDEHIDVYNLGLQGPDLFFYFFLSPILYKRNIGSIMHTKDIQEFKNQYFETIKSIKDEEERKIAIAYLAGFVGHCTLDAVCHPYIYAVTDYEHKGKNYFSKHVDLETEIDYIYVKKYKHMELYNFRKKETLNIDRMEIDTIARTFVDAFSRVYVNVKLSSRRMKLVINIFKQSSVIFNDKYGIKRVVVGKIEKWCLGKKVISPMFIIDKECRDLNDSTNRQHSEWRNPWQKEVTRNNSFNELVIEAEKIYANALDELNRAVSENGEGTYELWNSNLSLHSGLDCSIPS